MKWSTLWNAKSKEKNSHLKQLLKEKTPRKTKSKELLIN
jgi:hypothetical protein